MSTRYFREFRGGTGPVDPHTLLSSPLNDINDDFILDYLTTVFVVFFELHISLICHV